MSKHLECDVWEQLVKVFLSSSPLLETELQTLAAIPAFNCSEKITLYLYIHKSKYNSEYQM